MRFPSVLAAEFEKLRRSRITWITLAAYSFMIVTAGFFMWMMMNPGAAASLGLLGQKASLSLGGHTADWPSFLAFIVMMGGIGGLIICSIIAAYVFGREYAEGTAKNLLALPVSRVLFVAAKTIVTTAWFAVLTLWIIPLSWLVGVVVGLPGVPITLLLHAAAKLLALASLCLCCALLVAWVAVETRGYFAPLGFAIFTLVLGSVFGHTGWGPWVPWTIIGLFSGAAGEGVTPGWGSFAVMAGTFLIGIGLTIRHEVFADNGQ